MRTALFLSAAMLGLGLAAAQCASAQTLYKLIDKDGKITYSEEKPKHFDGQVVEMNIDPKANTATLPKANFSTPARKVTANDLNQAGDRLDKAKAALQDAKDHPTADEKMMVGKVGGGVRYVESDDYQKKIKQLEQDVKDAQDNLDKMKGS
jgi:hypothetical protein